MSCFLGAGGEVDHPSYYALLSLARPFVSGRAVSEAEMTGLIAALDPEKLKADAVPVETEPHLIFTDSEGLFGEAGLEEWMAFIRDSEGNLIGLASRHAPG